MKDSIKAAVKNVSAFGDTDIFPFSFEQHVFHDRPDLVENALDDLHCNFSARLAQNPPSNINTLSPVGYTGFRWATQIDPLWNAYYLALLIEIGPSIEQARIPMSDESVFSYRFVPPMPDGSIFHENGSWLAFMRASGECASKFPYVIVCDISDFYSRVYHHRVENALKWSNAKADVVSRIVKLLSAFSGTTSYGLPVGGPASRMLAELALNTVDKLLRGKRIRFCRYVDDYRIFCASKEEAYERLIFRNRSAFLSETGAADADRFL